MHTRIKPLGFDLSVATPMEDMIIVNGIYRDCMTQIETERLLANLILMPFCEFDVILGMD